MQELQVYSCGLKFAATSKGFAFSFGTVTDSGKITGFPWNRETAAKY